MLYHSDTNTRNVWSCKADLYYFTTVFLGEGPLKEKPE